MTVSDAGVPGEQRNDGQGDIQLCRVIRGGGWDAWNAFDALRVELQAARDELAQSKALTDRAMGAAEQAQAVVRRNAATAQTALAELAAARRTLDEAQAKVRAVELIHCWTNEDGKRFMFVSDVQAALGLPVEDAVRARRYEQCDDTCTADCGHCKGAGRPAAVPETRDKDGEQE